MAPPPRMRSAHEPSTWLQGHSAGTSAGRWVKFLVDKGSTMAIDPNLWRFFTLQVNLSLGFYALFPSLGQANASTGQEM